MKKGDPRWSVLFLIAAVLGILFVDMTGYEKWMVAGLIVLALINTIIGISNKQQT